MSTAPLRRIVALRMVTQDIDRLVRFYGEALGARSAGDAIAIDPAEAVLLGGGSGKRHRLLVGDLPIELDRFDSGGRPYPDADAANIRFQHFAVIVRDIAAAYDRATACRATSISHHGPVTLPRSAGGVTAVKLRDPDGHPFELLQFPADADNAWRDAPANSFGVLGVDHTAIAVADVERSRAFYAQAGLVERGATINRGPTQEALDGLLLVSVDVVPLYPTGETPHLELLGYHRAGACPVADLRVTDIAATRTVWASDHIALSRDPDGHLHQLTVAG